MAPTFRWLKSSANLIRYRYRTHTLLSLFAVSLSTFTLLSFRCPRSAEAAPVFSSKLNALGPRQMNTSELESDGEPFQVTPEQAQIIVNRQVGKEVKIEKYCELKSYGYSLPTKVYEIQIASVDPDTPSSSYIIKAIAPLHPSPDQSYLPNSLTTSAHLHTQISSRTDIPLATIHTTDVSCSDVPFPYMLISRPPGIPLSLARTQLSARQNALVDLRLGSYLKQLHDIENDWFGTPTERGGDPADPSYSWQETFTLFLEEMMYEAEGRGEEDVPFEDIRGFLSRAIGYYLFDDVEVPKLIWFTGGEEEILVDVPAAPVSSESNHTSTDEEPRISAFLNLTHAIWGDPLLESLFYSPSDALIEGYGGPLILFARQKTKRMWYSLFWGLVVLNEVAKMKTEAEGSGIEEEREKWAREVVRRCAKELKEAPCY